MILTRGTEVAEVKNEVQAAAFKNEGWVPSEGTAPANEPERRARKPREK